MPSFSGAPWAGHILVGFDLFGCGVISLSGALLRCTISHWDILRVGCSKIFQRVGGIRLYGDIPLIPVCRANLTVLWVKFL